MFHCYTHNWYSPQYRCPECLQFILSYTGDTHLPSPPPNDTPIAYIKLKPSINSSLLVENVEVTFREDKTAYGNRIWIQVEDSESNDNAELLKLVGKTFKAKLVLEEE